MRFADLPRIFLCLMVFGLVAVGAFAEDWPQFRGPDRNGVSKETGLLTQWPQGGPELLWTADGCGLGFSSVAIADGTIYVSGDSGQSCQVVALDLEGKVKWRRPFGQAHTRGRFPGTRSTPTVDGNSVYCLGPQGDLGCIDAKSGRLRWSVNIIKRFRGRNIQWKLSESVLVDGNNVICTPGANNATLAALNRNTGATVWTSKGLSDRAAYASPIAYKVGPGRIISTLTASGLVGVNAANGNFLWRYDRPSNRTANCPTPVFYRGAVFSASAYNTGGGLVRITASRSRVSINEIWQTADMDNHHGGFVVINDHIYGHGNRSGWLCIDFNTGRTIWRDRGVGKGSVISADGMLYCFSEGRTMGLVKVNPNRYELVSQFRMPRAGSRPTWAHPAIANGKLYLRDDDKLFCYDIKAK